jgi:hypothetical protein
MTQKDRDMKRLLPGIVLFFALICSAHAQIAQTAANSVRSQSITPKAVGNTLLVQCDYNGPAPLSAAITDSIGTIYASIGLINATADRSQFVSMSTALTSVLARAVRCPIPPSGTTFGEIYIVELTGGMSVDGLAQANGAATPALVTAPAASGDVVVAFCVTGTCSLASGWTPLSSFNNNLVAWQKSSASNVLSSFDVSSDWVLTAISLKPTVLSPPPLPITLTINTASPNISSLIFDDGTAVYVGAIIPQQLNGSSWISTGTVTCDADGLLTGTFTINPNYADSNGNVSFQFTLPGIANLGLQTMPLAKFQQGSTGFTIKEVLFKSLFLKSLLAVEKSTSVSLTP